MTVFQLEEVAGRGVLYKTSEEDEEEEAEGKEDAGAPCEVKLIKSDCDSRTS